MKTLFAISCSVLISSLAAVNAATVAVSPGFGASNGIVAQVGATPLPGDYYIAVGSYVMEPTITDYPSLVAAVEALNVFQTLGSPASGPTQGTISGSFTALGGADPGLFNNQQIYFVIGDGNSKANSTAWAIFKVTSDFPPDVTAAGSTPVSLPNVGLIEVLPNAGAPVDNTGARDNLVLVVPEPSALVLGLVGFVGLLRRRR